MVQDSWLLLLRHLQVAVTHSLQVFPCQMSYSPFQSYRRAGKGWREGELFLGHFFERAELFTGD